MPLGRPIEFEPEQALEAAMQQFWSAGYESTSLRELLTAMDLSKSSLYQTFGTKQQLFEKCIARYRDGMACDMLERLQNAQSGWCFIEETLYSVVEVTRGPIPPRGCLVMNSASEFSQGNPALAALISASLERFEGVFLQAVQRAQAEGDIPASKDARVLAQYLLTSMGGLRTMVKAGTDAKHIRQIVGVVLNALA